VAGFEHWLFLLAILAGGLQALGYILYLRDGHIDPNPLTWLMFAYGTAVLTILEFDRQASWGELFLPVVCAVMGILVAAKCWLRTKSFGGGLLDIFKPKDSLDKSAFSADVVITIVYVFCWVLASIQFISDGSRQTAALVFLIGSNLTTLTAFLPILKSTSAEPQRERATPWVIWTLAYASLLLLTVLNGNGFSELMLYPLSCTILHGLVAWYARPARRAPTAHAPAFNLQPTAANDAQAPEPHQQAA
jgi:hypothetical protein